MSDSEKLFEPSWKLPEEDFDNNINVIKPKPPPRNGSLKTTFSESEDGLSESCKSFEGESIDNLDIPVFRPVYSERMETYSRISRQNALPFPKNPCFSEFDEDDKLEYYGLINQIVQKLTTSKKLRYAVLLSNRLILFEKPEHKVSKLQIPLRSIKGIDWIDNINCTNKNDCNKFKLDTPIRSYKFQCSSHESAGLWINHIGKLIFDKQKFNDTIQLCLLKATVILENVKGKRIFTVEPKYTVAYYESEDDYKHGIAMHRIQLRLSGVKRDSVDMNSFNLITSYRKYKLTFESSSICNEWFQTLSEIIQNAISKNGKSEDEIMNEISQNTSNKFCAECKSPDIKWASVNLFVTLCPKCSGIHRGLGSNISRVQGIFTDESKWKDNNLIKLFQTIGNDNANRFWMACYTEEKSEIDAKSIYDKYVRKKFIEKKELIFEKYKDQTLLNQELLNNVKTEDVIRTMKLFQIGAELNYVSPLDGKSAYILAQDCNQQLQITFLNNQCKNQVKDWRTILFESNDSLTINETPFQERCLYCSINQDLKEQRLILIWNNCIQILENNSTKKEICKILFHSICLVREKKIELDQISLLVVVRESEYSNSNISINGIEFYGSETNQTNDLRDFKNVIGQNMFPNFIPTTSYDCIGWIILSTATKDWSPFLLVLNYNSIADFYDPKEINESKSSLSLDLRKVHKIEELRDNNYENICPFKMYNLASICLNSSVIYHVRSDTKEAYEELFKAFQQSWKVGDYSSLSNQLLTRNNVPLPVDKMIRYLQIHGTQIEGPFRRVGSVKEAEKICNQLIADPNSYVLNNCTPHDVASALKLFFRKLDNPLLTNELYKKWIAAVDLENSKDKLIYYKEITSELPLINYQTLRLLIFLFVNIVKNNHITQMDEDNLGTSFNTCLLRNSDDGFQPKNLQVLPYLIRNYQYLFDVTTEELEIEKKFNKGLLKINNEIYCPPSETNLLRQIYIHPELESYLKTDVNFEKEYTDKSNKSINLFSKQLNIEQSMTSNSLLKKLFQDVELKNIIIFEDMKIDDLHMQHLIYPEENLIEVIQCSEQSESKIISSKKWIFRLNTYDIEFKTNQKSLKCWASLSLSNKNKVFIELSETNQINIWKNDQMSELILNISIKGMVIFRSYDKEKFIVAFEDKKNQINTTSGRFQLFLFKSKSPFTFINFYSKLDYVNFLKLYDQSKLIELTPMKNRSDIAKCI